jgi:hypothetical protein
MIHTAACRDQVKAESQCNCAVRLCVTAQAHCLSQWMCMNMHHRLPAACDMDKASAVLSPRQNTRIHAYVTV